MIVTYLVALGIREQIISFTNCKVVIQSTEVQNYKHYKSICVSQNFYRDPILTKNGVFQKFENSHLFKPISILEKNNNKSDFFKKVGIFKLLEDPIPS